MGGVARNVGVVRKVEERVGLKALIAEEPQIVGASALRSSQKKPRSSPDEVGEPR
ncbi:MAG: hypothetical protein ACXQTZ_04460 [Candidatus Alkanophagales archaeon]